MFKDTSAFNQDISNWDVSNVTNFERMFKRAKAFGQDLSKWNIKNGISFIEMFQDSGSNCTVDEPKKEIICQ